MVESQLITIMEPLSYTALLILGVWMIFLGNGTIGATSPSFAGPMSRSAPTYAGESTGAAAGFDWERSREEVYDARELIKSMGVLKRRLETLIKAQPTIDNLRDAHQALEQVSEHCERLDRDVNFDKVKYKRKATTMPAKWGSIKTHLKILESEHKALQALEKVSAVLDKVVRRGVPPANKDQRDALRALVEEASKITNKLYWKLWRTYQTSAPNITGRFR